MKDIDVGFSSYYLFVDLSNESKFKKLTFGAPWDFDWSSGNVNGDFYYRTNNSYNSLISTRFLLFINSSPVSSGRSLRG